MARPNELLRPRKRGLKWFFIILVVVFELLVHAWIRTESTQMMIRISDTQAKIQEAVSYRKALGLELERLKSDARITRIARTRLGLTSDTFDQTIYLSNHLSGGLN